MAKNSAVHSRTPRVPGIHNIEAPKPKTKNRTPMSVPHAVQGSRQYVQMLAVCSPATQVAAVNGTANGINQHSGHKPIGDRDSKGRGAAHALPDEGRRCHSSFHEEGCHATDPWQWENSADPFYQRGREFLVFVRLMSVL